MARAKKPLEIKIKRVHENAVIPSIAYFGDAGADLTAVSMRTTDKYIEYDTGLQFEIPTGYVGLLFPRSSISKTAMTLANSVGVLDCKFRGNVTFRFNLTSENLNNYVQCGGKYKVGDRIGQLVIMPIPTVAFVETDTLEDSERGTGGYGSSDKKVTTNEN